MSEASNFDNKKRKRGRPSVSGEPGSQSVMIGVRLSPKMLADLDRYRQELDLGRPEAVRFILQDEFRTSRKAWERADKGKARRKG